MKNIVETAIEAGSFKTLVKAVKKAGLAGTLSSKIQFTVFAPTDEAFAKLPKKTLNSVLKDNRKLKDILTYHVVLGKVMAADAMKVKSVDTVQGESLMIDAANSVKVNDAKVVKPDIECSNGVIHVIDRVLIPQ